MLPRLPLLNQLRLSLSFLRCPLSHSCAHFYLSRLIVRYALVQLLARARARTCFVIRLAVIHLLVAIANIVHGLAS